MLSIFLPFFTFYTVRPSTMCTWHTHPAGMDPREWQAKAVMTYLSWSLPAAPGAVVGQSAPLGEGWQCCGGLP